MLQLRFKGSQVLMLVFSAVFSLFSSCTGQGAADTSDEMKQNQNKSTKSPMETKKNSNKTILCFGTSLTAGYGLDVKEAFPALIQEKIDAAGLPYTVINAGLSGETSAAGNSRIDWLLKQPVDLLILELGANDGLRGLPILETKKNLQEITDKVRKKYPEAKIVLAGMQIPPSMGAKYADEFKSLFPDLARKNDMKLVPFLLQGVGGVPKLNQEDGIHPTAEGQKILAENVWSVLKPIL
ncbi:arylesterase [Pedobacter gandavensis]|uniref:arylesterase n=1 Tax=Pedobacter gandavensis TaxID=2679963 RepID=UPI00292EACD0|nr:arylesterase [Pedobacter gandavensis]